MVFYDGKGESHLLRMLMVHKHSWTPMSCVAAEAWREDSDLGQQLQALHELFGDAILPWVPFLPGAAVFV